MTVSTVAREFTWTPPHIAGTIRNLMASHSQEVGDRLRLLRERRGWNQEDAAHALGVGSKTYGDWERGKHWPYEHNWKRIGEVFKVDPEEIKGAASLQPTPDQLDRFDARLDEVIKQIAELRELLASERAASDASQDDPGPVVLGDQDAPPTPGTPQQDENAEGEADEPDAG